MGHSNLTPFTGGVGRHSLLFFPIIVIWIEIAMWACEWERGAPYTCIISYKRIEIVTKNLEKDFAFKGH